jgi:hypothetical protein
VVEATVKRLLCCGFRCIGKVMRQVHQCWWRICQGINVFSQVRISHVLHFISICDLHTDSPSQMKSHKYMNKVSTHSMQCAVEKKIWEKLLSFHYILSILHHTDCIENTASNGPSIEPCAFVATECVCWAIA